MYQKKIKNMLMDHEDRITALENSIKTKEQIAPIDTKKGQEQKDKIREKLAEKAKQEEVELNSAKLLTEEVSADEVKEHSLSQTTQARGSNE